MFVGVANGSLLAVLVHFAGRAVHKLAKSVGTASLFRRAVCVRSAAFLQTRNRDVACLRQANFDQLKGYTLQVARQFVALTPGDWLAFAITQTPGLVTASRGKALAAIVTECKLDIATD